MPKKIKKSLTLRTEDDIRDAQPGDYCYYLNTSNKAIFAEVNKVFTENDVLVLQIICQQDYKFMSLPYYLCAFDEKQLKGKKRSDFK